MNRLRYVLFLLPLVLGGLSSCIRTHGVLYEAPRRYEGIWMPNNSAPRNNNTADMKLTSKLYLYEADGTWYLPVYKITYRQRPNLVGGWVHPPFERRVETGRDPHIYYLILSTETAARLRTVQHSALSPSRMAAADASPVLLQELPPHARAYPILCPVCDFGDDAGGLICRTETHVGASAVLAYPAAAVLALGVDLPVSVLCSGVGVAAEGVHAIFFPRRCPVDTAG